MTEDQRNLSFNIKFILRIFCGTISFRLSFRLLSLQKSFSNYCKFLIISNYYLIIYIFVILYACPKRSTKQNMHGIRLLKARTVGLACDPNTEYIIIL